MTKAIILAAGLGTRLRTLITDKPKCMVHVNGRPIIGWQISALIAAGLDDIAIVTGYHADVLRNYVSQEFPSAPITFIHSEDYATTNNMYSLWITRKHVGAASLVFMNADVAFDPEVIPRLLTAGRSGVAVDVGSYNEESMKVVRSAQNGYLSAISKQIEANAAFGSSIDVYYLEPGDACMLYDECDHIIRVEGQRKQWSELALHRLLESGRIKMIPVSVAGLCWYEIDSPEDLAIAETQFTANMLMGNPPKAYFLDLDGTIYLGERKIEGSADFVGQCLRQGAKVIFLSNNSSKSHADYVTRLRQLGIPAVESDILLSTDALASYLRETGFNRAYILGTAGMKSVLADYGVSHVDADPQVVLLGYHNQLTYAELARAALLLQDKSLPYLATHADMVCPTELGSIPDAGALAELLWATTGRRPERIFGKPSPDFVHERLAKLGLNPADCVMAGDRVYTDLALAKATGMRFLAVLSGEGRRIDFEGETDLMVASSLGHLVKRTV